MSGIGPMIPDEARAETRTLTTMLIITVKAPEAQVAKAPEGLEDIYNAALVQSRDQRIVKVEEPLDMPMGLTRHTMTERL